MAGVKGKSGRKKKSVLTRQANQVIMDSAPLAAEYLMKVSRGVIKRPNLMRVEVCKFVINHAVGTPRQKVEMKHTGSPLTYQQLADSAEEIIKKAAEEGKDLPEVLKEAEEVARKHEEAGHEEK